MVRFLPPIALGIVLAHFVWHVYFGTQTGEYYVGGDVTCLQAPSDSSQLYLRHTFHLAQRSRHGWLEILGRSSLKAYVNGQLVGEKHEDGFDIALLVDLTPYLRVGQNTIAIRCAQREAGQPTWAVAGREPPPRVAVQGAYDNGGRRCLINAHSPWCCSNVPARNSHWWFETEFVDLDWSAVERANDVIRASLQMPPAAVRQDSSAAMIGSPNPDEPVGVLRREFSIPDRVASAWFRMTANSDYRLAINGVVCDVQEESLGAYEPVAPRRRVYDVGSLLHPGKNLVAVQLSGGHVAPRMRADLEVVAKSGLCKRLRSDEAWLWQPGMSSDWSTDRRNGVPCAVESGDFGVPPWTRETEYWPICQTMTDALAKWIAQIGLALVLSCAACLCCRYMQWSLDAIHSDNDGAPFVAHLPMVLPGFALGLAALATFDPRVEAATVYQPRWILFAIAAIILQWFVFTLFARVGCSPWNRPARAHTKRLAVIGLVASIVGFAFWLRYSQIDLKPLQHDEASAYRSTQGFFERGFPSRQIHPDMPAKNVETSELVYFFDVLSACVFDQDIYVVRFPAVCWGTATVLLVFLVGARLYAIPVGLIAAAVMAISPICVQMSCFGRYFTQLQFFCLLTVLFFWLTIRESGTINRRYLWCTAASFLAMYFSWQGSALLAPGLIVACLWSRRRDFHTVVWNRDVGIALVLVSCVVALHISVRSLHLVQFLAFGTGISSLGLKAMWKHPDFDITFCIWESAWNRDALFPLLGLSAACLMAVRHPFQRPLRFLLIVFFTTCFVKALLLPVYTWRYSFHLMPMGILLASVAWYGLCRALVSRDIRHADEWAWSIPSHIVVTTVTIAIVPIASGATLQLTQLGGTHIHTYSLPDLKFSDLAGATAFVQARLTDKDIVLASTPHVVDHFLGHAASDYWPQSRFYTQAVLDDHRDIPLHRIAGTTMISTREELANLFAKHDRIWYVLIPSRHESQNTAEVSAFVRQQMKVAYEGYRSMVLVRDHGHWPASQRISNDRSLIEAYADFLVD